MRNLIVIALIACATVAQANPGYRCNAHGAVIISEPGKTYYLGKTCDAATADGGTGRWWYSASALIVDIPGAGLMIRYDVECDLPYCRPAG
ncbi:hypothetical protein JANAI62_26220 [Jannaschia pagri]|uniref:Uncharacterized protein n=1 Tax=Jannaschia pagri TaxID=2829797 RepID=A0ABQ4NP51_9RHOB|nr:MULTISPECIES: hypothetical protein [unclassified Jannaschia]GIT92164.1 hypothetical protein JANAI61_26220 [Jannaschia sp. AI_61]GIT95999.1 hypothetical protein JANAI62_26220 [Jannaschia sp. AI_62]